MRGPISIADSKLKPGQQATIHIPVARLYTLTEMTMPVHIIHGNQEGPRLFVSAAIHGDEINGTEIIRRLMKLKKIKKLKGTLIAVPVVNVYGFLKQSRYSPDRRDLNRFFPGSEKGSLTSQLADIFMDEIVANSTHGIDLHAGSNHRTNFPQIRANTDDPEVLRLAQAFRVPIIINANIRDGSLRQALAEKGIPFLLYEAGEALRFDEFAIRAGIRGIVSVMETIGMLRSSRARKAVIEPLIADATTWLRAPASGILHMNVPLGAKVAKNKKIGVIADPFGGQEAVIESPVSGMVIGRLNLPLVHQGDAVIHIAQIDHLAGIEPIIADFREDVIGES
ncbi:MAG: succinylglutamate desuccinylase/aspartoacylase family protein [Deltaproteobacteria bacterium]|jgi:predicted deacylase|nr:succinylglutamate desuccinylase/aspartoacylase family protein [Deltaproteobacteria bacterium]MBW2487840.1 succinylglutamate desuccinylase/aspartoacylase family protein [Deltaproteobacteria bacterium]